MLFGDRKETVQVAKLLIAKMKETSTLSITRRQMRAFAVERTTGELGVKYGHHNFYTKLLRKLLDMGLVERDAMIWDPKRRKTVRVYRLLIQPIPDKSPYSGFVKHVWQIAKGWNNLIKG